MGAFTEALFYTWYTNLNFPSRGPYIALTYRLPSPKTLHLKPPLKKDSPPTMQVPAGYAEASAIHVPGSWRRT